MKWNDYFVYKRELILSLAAHIGKWPLLQAVMSVICCEIGNQKNTSYFPHSVFTFCCCIVAFFIPISRSQVSICNAGFEIDIAKHLFEATQAMLELLVLLELLLLVLQLPLRSKCFEFRCQRRCRRLCRRFGRPISQSTLCDGHGWGIHTLIRTHTHTQKPCTRTRTLFALLPVFNALKQFASQGKVSFVRTLGAPLNCSRNETKVLSALYRRCHLHAKTV